MICSLEYILIYFQAVAEFPILPENGTRATRSICVQTDPPKKQHNRSEATDEINYFLCKIENNGITSTAECQVSIAPPKITQADTNPEHGFFGSQSVRSDEDMNVLCGVSLAAFQLLLKVLPPMKYHKVTTENKLVIFLMKLKLGLCFSAISVLFGVHRSTISRIFVSVLEALDVSLTSFIRWPARHVVQEYLPNAFKAHYPNCRVIIDCTEVKVENPPTLQQRVLMYSNYKSAETIKFLVACTPYGLISFVSDCYGGRASDAFITNDCGILDKLEAKDEVMADKGFPTIKTDVENRNAIFVMPPFAYNAQFTVEEMNTTYEIASVRIHIERCIQRLKIYRILSHIPVELLPNCDRIVRICCALVNLQKPIIKIDK